MPTAWWTALPASTDPHSCVTEPGLGGQPLGGLCYPPGRWIGTNVPCLILGAGTQWVLQILEDTWHLPGALGGGVVTLVLQMGKLRARERKRFAQDLTAAD